MKSIPKILKRVGGKSYRQKTAYFKDRILPDRNMSFILTFESRDGAQEQSSSGNFKTF